MITLHKCNECGKKYGTIQSKNSCCKGLEIVLPGDKNKSRSEYQKEYLRLKNGYYEKERKQIRVIDTETKVIYPSISAAARALLVSNTSLSTKLRGKRSNNTKMIFYNDSNIQL